MGFIAELKRRNVVRVGIAYLVIAWLTLQVGEVMAPALRLPDWINSALAFFLVLGLPIALFFAWAFEVTPDGIKKEKDVDRSRSITTETAKKVDRVIIGVLVVAVAFFAFDKFVLDPSRDAELVQASGEATGEAAGTIDRNSIAVLPFADLSPEGDQEYFSDGIAEEILNVLVRVDELSVASRTSSFGFKGQEALGIPAIAEKLKVGHVLEGSVRKAGDTVRITAQLIDAETDQHLWSATYDRTLSAESIFAIQDEIAKAIVGELGILIDGRSVPADTQNLDAYELYLKAHKMFIERSDILGAVDAFEQAVAADPGFARATAGLAAAYVIAPSWEFVEREFYRLASDTAEQAIELDDSLALPYAVLGYAELERGEYESAFANYDIALRLNPNDPTVWLWRGILNNILGYFEQAAADIDRCLAIDPAYTNCIRHRARNLLFLGDEDRALKLFERAIRFGFPSNNAMMLQIYARRGDHATVLLAIAGRLRPRGYAPLIDYQYRAIVDPAFDFDTERAEIETVYKAVTGDELDWSDEDVFDPQTFGAYDEVPVDLWLQAWWHPYPVEWRTSPHRKRLMREAGFPDYWRKHGFPPQCRPIGDDDFECESLTGKSRADQRKRVTVPQ